MPVVCPTGWEVEDRLPAGVKIAVDFPSFSRNKTICRPFININEQTIFLDKILIAC